MASKLKRALTFNGLIRRNRSNEGRKTQEDDEVSDTRSRHRLSRSMHSLDDILKELSEAMGTRSPTTSPKPPSSPNLEDKYVAMHNEVVYDIFRKMNY